MPYAPTLSAFVDASPCPRVEVYFATLPTGTATVTVTRLAERREFKVRGAVRAATAGTLSRFDFEIPLGVPVVYRGECFDAAGMSLGFTTEAEITLPENPQTWIHNPIDPSGAVLVDVDNLSAQELTYQVEGELVRPQGRRVAVVVSGSRRGLVDVPLKISTDTEAQAEKVRELLGGYDRDVPAVLCVRAPRQLRIPRTLFTGTLEIGERPVNAHLDGQLSEWTMKINEAAPPAPALIVPLLRRRDIRAAFATRAAVKNGNLNRLAVNRRYDLAGTAQ